MLLIYLQSIILYGVLPFVDWLESEEFFEDGSGGGILGGEGGRGSRPSRLAEGFQVWRYPDALFSFPLVFSWWVFWVL